MFKLCITIRVIGTLPRLAVSLETEAEPAQESTHQLVAYFKTMLGQRLRQVPLTLADPQQRCFRVTTNRRPHQLFERLKQARLGLHRGLTSGTGTADAARIFVLPGG